MNYLVPFNYQAPQYRIAFRPGEAVDVHLGTGVNMNDPLFYWMKPQVFTGEPIRLPPEVRSDGNDDLVTSVAATFQSENVREEAERLSVNFAASFGIGSGSAAYQKARTEYKKKAIFYIDIQVLGEGSSIKREHIAWITPPSAEAIDDLDERTRQFLADYGSHYISRIYLGKKITIRAAYEYEDIREVESYSVSVRAAAASWSAGGGLSKEHSLRLSSTRSDVRTAIISGGLSDPGAGYANSIEETLLLLARVRAGEVKIAPGPIAADVESFWSTLINHKRSREIFEVKPGQKADAPYGVPRGTVIAWYPRESDWAPVPASPDKFELNVPDGWALCNGVNGTPDLVDRFIMGVTTKFDVNSSAGSAEHTHVVEGTTDRDAQGGSDHGFWARSDGKVHNHRFKVESKSGSSMPPYTGLIYIIKT